MFSWEIHPYSFIFTAFPEGSAVAGMIFFAEAARLFLFSNCAGAASVRAAAGRQAQPRTFSSRTA
ncbi:MAG: hypothetical protein DBY36_09035 [Clostridiales bacterium]|nr:MAG: hypothetical protein DBY36_09035 [Clostridiales bacterium]